MDETFCGDKADARAARNIFFLESRHSRNARKQLETEKMLILGHF